MANPYLELVEQGLRPVYVYLSASRTDMWAERQLFAQRLAPELDRRCRKFNAFLVPELPGTEQLSTVMNDEYSYGLYRLETAIPGLKRYRPVFICLLGDCVGWTHEFFPKDVCEILPWLQDERERCVIELEILYAALRRKKLCKHTFFYFRDNSRMQDIPWPVCDYYQARYEGEAEKVQSIKETVREAGLPIHEYGCRWDQPSQMVVGLEELEARMLEDIWGAITTTLREQGTDVTKATEPVPEPEPVGAGLAAGIGPARKLQIPKLQASSTAKPRDLGWDELERPQPAVASRQAGVFPALGGGGSGPPPSVAPRSPASVAAPLAPATVAPPVESPAPNLAATAASSISAALAAKALPGQQDKLREPVPPAPTREDDAEVRAIEEREKTWQGVAPDGMFAVVGLVVLVTGFKLPGLAPVLYLLVAPALGVIYGLTRRQPIAAACVGGIGTVLVVLGLLMAPEQGTIPVLAIISFLLAAGGGYGGAVLPGYLRQGRP